MDYSHEEVYRYHGRYYRWCQNHGVFHGYLYACPFFSKKLQAEIRSQDRKVLAITVDVCIVIIFVVLLIAYQGRVQ